MFQEDDSFKNTDCSQIHLEFHALGRREAIGRFDGGMIRSIGGALLLRKTELRTDIVRRLERQFTGHRDPDRIDPRVEELVIHTLLKNL